MSDPIRSREDRLDPDAVSRRHAQGLRGLAGPPWAGFLRALGVNDELLAEARSLLDGHDARFARLDVDTEVLAAHGWLLFELSPDAAYRDAAALIRDGRVEEAEQLIVDAWNASDCSLLRLAVHRVDGLYFDVAAEYDTDPDGLEVGHSRAALIREALECHRATNYAAAVTLALAQIDGIVADFSDGGHSFFARDRATHEPRANLTDDTTLAGHPGALLALARMLTEKCHRTETSGRLLRHGIMHGRELGYGSLRNSTQALATLLAVIVWAQPIARARIDAADAAREAAHAGTDDRDQHGRRLSRAGFVEAKFALEALADYQDSFHDQHGRYARSIEELDPTELLLRDEFPDAGTAAATDGQRYWAWLPTGSDYVFGLAGAGGEAIRWRYAGRRFPAGGPGGDAGWRHPVDDPAHPDW